MLANNRSRDNEFLIWRLKGRRKRPSLVCSNCRIKKIKCDRQQPCSNCIKSSLISTCTYEIHARLAFDKSNCEKSIRSDESILGFDDDELSGMNDDHQSILDENIFDVTVFRVLRKPSNTQLRPAFYSAYMKQNHILSFKYLMSFKRFINTNRSLWKSKNFDRSFQLMEVQCGENITNIHNDVLNQSIEKTMCTNYYALLERLEYFQTDLNKVLFNSYIPMGVIHSIFNHYFLVTKKGIVFRHPKKSYEYCYIALIGSLVELSNIFTKSDDSHFDLSLSLKSNELNELTVKLLNASNYRRKISIFGVYTLLNLRLSLMIYGDAQSSGLIMQKTLPLFKSAVDISIEMGLHVNLDQVEFFEQTNDDDKDYILFARDIPIDSMKQLWNYLLITDASYYIDVIIPPCIDERFTNGFYSSLLKENSIFEEIVKVSKEISMNFSGSKHYSLKTIKEYLTRLNKILESMGSFEDVELVEKNEDKWLSFDFMFKILKLLFIFQFKLLALLDDANLNNYFSKECLGDKKNLKIIKSLKKESSLKIKLIYYIGISAIFKMTQSDLGYKFMLYHREVFSSWIGFNTILFIDMVLVDISKKKYSSKNKPTMPSPMKKKFELPQPPIFNIKELENTYFHFCAAKHSQTLLKIEESCQVESLVSLLSDLYEKTINIPALFTDYNFVQMTKLFFLTIYFLYCYLVCYYRSYKDVYASLDKLKLTTQNGITEVLQNGKLSHLLPAQEIVKELRDGHNGAEENIQEKKNINVNNNIGSQLDPTFINCNSGAGRGEDSVIDLNAESMNSIFLPSQFDDIASAVFQDEGLINMLDDINRYFNQPNF